ncbi:MAG: hypothetical protein ACTSPQ_18550, partial [Candidatus Helarchaeota archaeon]
MEKILGFFEKKNGFIISLIITIIVGFLLQLIGFIWEYAWILMLIAGFLGGFLIKSGGKGFLVGFAGVICAWGIYFIIFSIIGPFLTFADIIAGIMGLENMGF